MEKRKNYLKIKYYDHQKRPLLLILPGGGYQLTSEREAKPIMDEFIKIGFHQAIFYYREENYKYPLILDDAINHLRTLTNDKLISDIHIIGFSAGGHLAGLLLTKYPKFFRSGILCYPVISTKDNVIHVDSFKNLLKEYPNELNEVSVETLVSRDTPPIYLWHTKEDKVVSYLNSVLLKESLDKHKINNKLTLFDKGPHGLSLIFYEEFKNEYDENKKWIKEAKDWLLSFK